MSGHILIGAGRDIRTIPDDHFISAMERMPERMAARLAFMSADHHVVRDFAVREMPRQKQPLSPSSIASVTGLKVSHVIAILEDLERKLFFLARNSNGDVSWAFPVTTDQTAHHLSFSNGEKIFGAWAEDAFATPFVQGRLRGDRLSVRIDSECRHCSRRIKLQVNDQLEWRVLSPGAEPLVFMPDIKWETFGGSNIIHDYWNQTVFFWSEDHARDYRSQHQQPDGTYLCLDQARFSERIAQSGLFAIGPTGKLRR